MGSGPIVAPFFFFSFSFFSFCLAMCSHTDSYQYIPYDVKLLNTWSVIAKMKQNRSKENMQTAAAKWCHQNA